MTRVPFTHTWIEQDKILIGSIPQLPTDLDTLGRLGIKTVCSLTRRDPRSYEGMPNPIYGLRWYRLAIPDGGITDDERMRDAAAYIDACYKADLPIYVHCRGGIGRSGTILIAYYVLHRGMTVEQARDMVRVRRNYEGNACAADQGSPQKEWIEGLK